MISKLFPYQELLCHSRPALRVVVAGGGDGSGGGGVCVCIPVAYQNADPVKTL